MPHFRHQGWKISYDEYGEGDRPLVLIHGLLMNRRMFERLGPAMADRGNRVIAIDLLGHGSSDRPPEMVNYSMTFFAQQIVALLDHLELEQAVIGGTSLGANATLETAHVAPERVRAMMVEMPVLDNALLGVSAIFTPILLALRFGEPLLKAVSAVTSRIPRTNFMLDIGLDWLRQDPVPSSAVLEGLFLGRAAPHHDERVKMEQPTLVIGHRADPLHPFSDSGMLCEELPNASLIEASSIIEWRLTPARLDDELAAFLDEVWGGPTRPAEAEAGVKSTG
jgi:pimeloyl-ACP methyl ester carboxylesterase